MVETADTLRPQSLEFKVGGISLHAKKYGNDAGQPVIAVHGWLDNCASFSFLAKYLKNLNLICIDCAGHGLSGHRAHLGAYNIWQDIVEIYSIAQQLGWDRFSLIGHSRGAMIAFLAAGTLPEKVSHLILIEGIYPRVAVAKDAPRILEHSVQRLLMTETKSPKIYETFEQAVQTRQNGFTSLSWEDAEVLARHGVRQSEEGFYWQYDPKLTIGSEFRLSIEQVDAFQARILASTTLFQASAGLMVTEELLQEQLRSFKECQIINIEGDHHLHMSAHCELIATEINRQFNV